MTSNFYDHKIFMQELLIHACSASEDAKDEHTSLFTNDIFGHIVQGPVVQN